MSREQISIASEIDYIIKLAASRDARIVTLGGLILFSTQTGDAWALDAEDSLAVCLARDGDRQPFRVFESSGSFGIEWQANFRVDGELFTVIEPEGRVKTICGYPTQEIRQAMRRIGS